MRPAADFAILATHRGGRAIGAQVRFLACVFAGHDLVGLAAGAVEVKNELEARSQSALPVTGHSRPLIPDVPREAPPSLLAHPFEPRIPIRSHLVVAVDEAQIDQYLAFARHRQMCEHTAHQAIPIVDTARGVVALVAVGRRGEAQLRRLTVHQRGDHAPVAGVATDQAMLTDTPDIAGTGHRQDGRVRHIVRSVRLISVWFRLGIRLGAQHITGEQCLDLGILEAGQRQVVSSLGQIGQFQRQHFLVPASIQRQPVVRDHQRALLRDGEVCQFNHRHLSQPQLAGGGQTPVSGNDAVVAIDQDRVCPAVLDDAGRDLGDLALGVRARVAGVGNQRLDLAVLDVERVQSGNPKNKTRQALPPDGLE